MGRTRPKKTPAKPAAAPPNTAALLEKAQALVVQCDYDLAARFARRILETEPDNAEAREILGVSLLEAGDVDGAKQVRASFVARNTRAHGIDKVFTSLLSLAPPPPSAHLYLAQLADDDPRLALQHFAAAVEILTQQLKGKDRETAEKRARSDEAEIKGNVVRALIGQVEIWMDPSYDLWQVQR